MTKYLKLTGREEVVAAAAAAAACDALFGALLQRSFEREREREFKNFMVPNRLLKSQSPVIL